MTSLTTKLVEMTIKENYPEILFSKLIPEFYSLAMADQEYLLRSTILELLILKVRFSTWNTSEKLLSDYLVLFQLQRW